MWLIISTVITDGAGRGAVVGTLRQEPPTGAYGPDVEYKEWNGDEPPVHDPISGIESYDPTIDDPDYPDFEQASQDFRDLYAQAATEIQWLEDNIPLVPTADLDTLRAYLQRVMIEQRKKLQAWRYLGKNIVRGI